VIENKESIGRILIFIKWSNGIYSRCNYEKENFS